MFEEREIAMLLVGVTSGAAWLGLRSGLPPLPGHRWWLAAGGLWLLGATVTTFEGLFPAIAPALDFVEHAAWIAATAALVGWAATLPAGAPR